MEKSYNLKLFLLPIECFVFLFMWSFLIICLLCALSSYVVTINIFLFTYYIKIVFNVLFSCLILYFIRILFEREIKVINYIFYNDFLIKKSPYRIISKEHNQIKDIKFIGIPYIFGWINIYYDNENINISLRTNNLTELLSNIKEKIKTKNIFNISFEKKYENLLVYSKYFESFYIRINDYLFYFISIATTLCFINVITAIFLWDKSIKFAFMWAFYSLILFLISIFISETIILFIQNKIKNSDIFKKHFEVKIYFVVGIIFFCFYLLSGMFFKVFLL